MKEITRIITCEITYITKGEDKSAVPVSEEKMRMLADVIKREMDADSVVVTRAQNFVRDEVEK